MDVFEQAKRTVSELKQSLNQIVKETFEKNGYVIKEIQTQKQLYQGEDSKGSFIRPAYKPMTIRIKMKKGQPTDRVTLKDTGKFYNNIKVIANETFVEVTTSIEYSKELFKKYGNNILGIQEELLRDFAEQYILPNIKHSFNDKLTRP